MNNLQAAPAGRQVNQYLQNQLNRAPSLLRTYTQDKQGNKYLTRNMFIRVEKIIKDFIAGQREIRVVNELGADLCSVFDEHQKILGVPFEKLDRNLFIFIDEIHFDKRWAVALKTIYDRSKRIFVVFCTGSSALSLQGTTDLARRVVFEKLYPMNFTEYMLLKTGYESIKDKNRHHQISRKRVKRWGAFTHFNQSADRQSGGKGFTELRQIRYRYLSHDQKHSFAGC